MKHSCIGKSWWQMQTRQQQKELTLERMMTLQGWLADKDVRKSTVRAIATDSFTIRIQNFHGLLSVLEEILVKSHRTWSDLSSCQLYRDRDEPVAWFVHCEFVDAEDAILGK